MGAVKVNSSTCCSLISAKVLSDDGMWVGGRVFVVRTYVTCGRPDVSRRVDKRKAHTSGYPDQRKNIEGLRDRQCKWLSVGSQGHVGR